MQLFVTGTDTEVGKTVATACLAQAARAWGTVVAAKPVASGVEPGTPGTDASLIAAGAGHAPQVFATWTAPLSPHRASRVESSPVDARGLEAWVRALSGDTVLVEGVGGWRVPIVEEPPVWVADLARWTGGPVVVVAADRLGCLNHSLLTVDAVRRDGLRVLGVVLTAAGADPDDVSTRTNLEDLRLLLDVPVVPLPRIDPADGVARAVAGRALWTALGVTGPGG